MRYKFFSKTRINKIQIDWLKRSRRVLAGHKVMTYGDAEFFEHYNYEKPIYVNPVNDAINNELDALVVGDNGEYDYSSLSSDLKKYMRFKDDEFYNKAYNEWANSDKFAEIRRERHIDSVEEVLDRELFQEELMVILEGARMAVPKPLYLNAKDSSRRSYKRVIDLIRANLFRFETFITLTFARKEHELKYLQNGLDFELIDDAMDFESVKKIFSKFIDAIKVSHKRKELEFEYIAVFEEHKDGTYHFHMICTKIDDAYLVPAPEYIDKDYKTGKRRFGKMLKHWKYGKSDVEVIRDKERMSTYLCKYLVKNFNNLSDTEETYLEYLNKKRYFSSKGLDKPSVEYISHSSDACDEIIEKRKAEYMDVYSTTYKNPYSDSFIERTICSKKHYNIVG